MNNFILNNKQYLFIIFLLVGICVLSFNSIAQDVFLRIGTAGTGGAYYPVGGGMAEVLTKELPGVFASAEVTGGAQENPRLVASGELEMGFTNADLLYFAYNGREPYKEGLPIASLVEFGPSVVHLCTLDPEIKNVADLKGKKVAIGPAGGSLSSMFSLYIQYFGLDMSDIRPSYVSQSEGISLLIDGSVDAAIGQGAPPIASVLELSARRDNFEIIEFEDKIMGEIIKDNPYFSKFIVTAGLYSGNPKEDVQTIKVANFMFAHQDMDEELAYNIVKTLYENIEYLYEVHSSFTFMPTDTVPSSPIPLHPGAERYYKEKGFKVE
jgi:hypothetical protein